MVQFVDWDLAASTAGALGKSGPKVSLEEAAEAVAELARSGVRIADFSLGQPSLDEVFLALTGHTAEESAEEADMQEERAA